MRKNILAGNWKMFKSIKELSGFFSSLTSGLGGNAKEATEKVDVIFAVPYTLLSEANKIASPLGIRISAQNCHFEESGAYTGEVSIAMLKELGIGVTLIGHSERRQYFAETDETVSLKTRAALKEGITPIVCVGETKEEREGNETKQVVEKQITAAFEGIDDPKDLIIAYEPVWAIGTGLTASNEQAQEVHCFIRELVAKRYSESVSSSMRILYGGSAKPTNIDDLLAQADIDGGLVGGASLKPEDFSKMIVSGAK